MPGTHNPGELTSESWRFHSYLRFTFCKKEKMNQTRFTTSAPMLVTKSVKRSAEFYRDSLGFEIDFIYEGFVSNQPNYAVVRRDGLEVHFESYEHDNVKDPEPRVKCGVYFMVDDVDAFHEELIGRHVAVNYPPTNQSYGIRDFKIFDLDGYQLLFGSPIASVAESGSGEY
ncbi:MAG: hypothetical protein EA425_14980 [Puniceicoccaceae bacterium]|nr:MAG: hypothetical protein EA425_14980 [Puniceicoccaceae bacterium]